MPPQLASMLRDGPIRRIAAVANESAAFLVRRVSRRLRRLSTGAAAAAGVIILAASMIAVALAVWRVRSDELESQIEAARKIAVVLSGQIEKAIQAMDITLLDIQERMGREGLEQAESLAPYVRLRWSRPALRERLARLPQAGSIAIADEDGRLLSSTNVSIEGVTVTDRDYFRELKSGRDNTLAISMPIRNRVTGLPNIIFARRLVGSEGQFIGIAIVAVEVDYFRRISSTVESVEDMTVLLAKRDGQVIVRHPDAIDRAGARLADNSPWHALSAKGGGAYRSSGFFDGIPRWVAVHSMKEYPLVLTVSISERTALARWRSMAVAILAGAGFLVSCAAFLLWAYLIQFGRLKRSRARLQEKSAALALSNIRFDSALNNISQGLCMFDSDRKVVVSNTRFAEIYRLRPQEVIGQTRIAALQAICETRGTASAAWNKIALGDAAETIDEIEHLPDGRTVHVVGRPMSGGGWMTTHEDITERHRSEKQVAHLARHDMLTGLLNRAGFAEKVEEAGARLRRWGESFSIVLLDLDRFKQINDTLGHPAGDALLREVARRLRATIRETDALARFGGDEFALIQSHTKDPHKDATAYAQRIIDVLAEPFVVDGQELIVSTSIGIALAPEHGVDPDDLIKDADIALYRAKANGRNGLVLFHPEMMEHANAQRKLERELRQAIVNGEFVLYYQPQIEVKTGRVAGAEALLRWRHPEKGIVGPNDFIPVAEETGLIDQIGEWILRQACVEAATWPADKKVAVNLSPAQFRRKNLYEAIVNALDSSGLAPDRLELEITESVLLESESSNLATIKKLRRLGVSIALDDFGKGYSSLSYLTIFPFNKIKIDKYFSFNLSRSDCAAIVASVITLARGLGMSTTAEGVETVRQFKLLREAGVDHCQGYLFGRALPASELDFDVVHDLKKKTQAAA